MRIYLRTLALAGLAVGLSLASLAQAAHPPAATPATATASTAAVPAQAPDDPVADPKAVVTIGHARFTILTPQLIRMEWSADGKFEDHASFVFINRRLPVPKIRIG